MSEKKKKKGNTQIKNNLHPKNKNRGKYNLKEIIKEFPELKKHIVPNKIGEDSIHFSNPEAVKILNRALLSNYYGIKYWEFPDTNLCPPIPGRADYVHYISDLLDTKKDVLCLDIGVGASCIYPIIGISEYKWEFIACDVNKEAIESAKNIVSKNPSLKGKVKFRIQKDGNKIFKSIIKPKDKINVSICNPPFHSSKKEALKGSRRKVRNLTGIKSKNIQSNFSGMANEIVFKGGEYQFIQNMIQESINFSKNCFWFTSLVSKEENLKGIYSTLKKIKTTEIKTINMATGNKISRIVAWTFLTKEEQNTWREN